MRGINLQNQIKERERQYLAFPFCMAQQQNHAFAFKYFKASVPAIMPS